MHPIRFLFLSVVFLLGVVQSFGQDFSNKGKEFWIPYSYHVGAGGANVVMTLYITSDVNTSYQVAVHGGVTIQSGNLTAGQVVTCIVPNTYFIPDEGLYSGKSIVVTSDKGVVVYSYVTQSAVSGATVCLPTNVLGREYISMNYTQVSNQANANSYFTVIAAEDNTTVEITPSSDTKNGWVAGTTYTVNLNKGQIYQVLGTHNNTPSGGLFSGSDLTGSKIKSVASGQSACKRIAVFSGSGKIRIGANCGNNNSSDNLYQQLYPQATWGKSYLTVPSFNRPNNIYRIIRSNTATNVYVNGVLVPTGSFTNGYYEFANNTPNHITADQPISVAQYFTTQGCSSNGSPYDPDMIILNPVEQNISRVTLVSSNLVATQNRQHHIHVIMPNGGTGISSFRFDGAPIPATASWVQHPTLPGYSYLYLSNVAQGYHTLVSDSGFNALAYGYANAESYGYSAGANVKDLYQYISIQNQFATVNFPATCRNAPFYFSMTFPYQPTQIQWVFGAALNGQGIANVSVPNPTPTGTVVVNGKTLYIYKLPNPYTIGTAGTYQIKVLATNPSPDGCSGEQEINFDLEVQPIPIADFTTSNVCEGTNVQFTDASSTNGRPISTYYWDFGDNTTGNTLNPAHGYPAPGTYNPRYSVITDIGCLSDTVTKVVTVFPKPTATIAGTVGICQGAPEPQITFTGANGTAPYRFTYTLNGGAPQQIVTTSGNSITLSVPTNTVGAFVYALTNVSDASPLNCAQTQTGTATVTVFSKPTGATITGSTAVCLNGTPPTITLTGQGGSGNYLFTYNLNGGANQTLTSTGGSATFTVPTNTAGTFTYNLISVEDPSNTLCRTDVNTAATVTVNPLPTATLVGTTAVCQNAAAPSITFTGAGGTAPYTFVYTINGGANQQVVSGANGIATVAVPTTASGTFTYSLQSVTDGSTTLCTQVQTGQAIVTVNPLPTASIAGTIAVCQNATQPQITFTGASGTAPYTFTYNINGGATQTVITTTGNSINVSAPTSVVGSFTYNLINVTDASNTICTQNQTGSVTVTVNPLPTATVAGSVNVCLNATQPQITFTGASATAPYTFSYNINGGAAQTVTTTTGNSVTVNAPTTSAGTFVYNLLSVTDASATVCSQNQTGSATVVVYPLPTATFTTTAPLCETGIVSFTDQSVANAGAVTGWSWNFGDPGSGANNTSILQNPQHAFATAGTYNVTLTVTTDNGCVSINPAIPVTIHAKPLAGFINPEVCLNDTYAQFTDTSSVATPSTLTTWSWTFGDPGSGVNNTSTLQNPQHSYLAVGSYPVVLIVTSNQGCKDTVNQTLFVNGSFPVSNFFINNTNNLCANDSISITDAATVLPGVITKVEIFWDDAGQPTVFETDQNPTPGKIYKHKYPNFQSPLTRTYNIRYRAYSGGVCSNDKVIPITINAAPRVQFNSIPPICLDATPYQITQASEIGGVPGTLLFTGPGVSSTGLFNPAIAGSGTHTLHFYFTSTAGGCIDSATQTIKVWVAPVADFSVSSPVCERQAVTFTSSSSSTEGTLTEWRWDFGDGTPVLVQNNGNPVQHTFTTFGNFTVKLNVVTSNGCISVAKTMTVVVKPLPRPNFNFPAVSCLPNANVAFTNLSSIPDGTQGSFTYLWNFGDPGSGPVNTSTATNPTHIYAALGPYNVNLQVTTGAGCIHDTTIVLNTLHPQPTGSFTTDKVDVCVGGAIQFNSTSNGADGTITQWVWDMDNGDTRNQSTFNYTYPAVGTYNVSHYIVNSFNCRSTTETKTVSINPYPIADAGPDKLMLEGGQTQLTPVNNNNMPITVQWSPATFLSDATVLSPIARPTDDITYRFFITTDKGCSAQDDVFVKVLKTPSVPNIFSPNGDGVHDTWVIPYLDTYPGCTVEVANRYGQIVFRSVGYPSPWDGRVNGKPVPVGTYYYVIDPKNGRKRLAGYVDVIR